MKQDVWLLYLIHSETSKIYDVIGPMKELIYFTIG